ncbi:hypothetical protein K8R03_00335 [Candidatus Kaiserbacteria bacterium]|nr:hypothetical protein [Candidatus Kaiserbacteria bacterium]
MEMEHSPYLDAIPAEATQAAQEYMEQNQNIVEMLTRAETAMEVDSSRSEILAAADDFFTQRGIKSGDGRRALTNALISTWSKLHPLDSATE